MALTDRERQLLKQIESGLRADAPARPRLRGPAVDIRRGLLLAAAGLVLGLVTVYAGLRLAASDGAGHAGVGVGVLGGCFVTLACWFATRDALRHR